MIRRKLFGARKLCSGAIFSVVMFVYIFLDQQHVSLVVKKFWRDDKMLENIVRNRKLTLESSKNIFFHETTPTSDGIIKLNSRQACAVESFGEN